MPRLPVWLEREQVPPPGLERRPFWLAGFIGMPANIVVFRLLSNIKLWTVGFEDTFFGTLTFFLTGPWKVFFLFLPRVGVDGGG
jgi:hypothetical protein